MTTPSWLRPAGSLRRCSERQWNGRRAGKHKGRPDGIWWVEKDKQCWYCSSLGMNIISIDHALKWTCPLWLMGREYKSIEYDMNVYDRQDY